MKSKKTNIPLGKKIQDLRNELGMSIANLSERSKVDTETLIRLEAGTETIKFDQLNDIADSLFADLTVELTPKKPISEILVDQARKKATEMVKYVQGTMSLEAQQPEKQFIDSLIEEETEKLLSSKSDLIWEE